MVSIAPIGLHGIYSPNFFLLTVRTTYGDAGCKPFYLDTILLLWFPKGQI